jgi:CBS domain containing-hemolysin-like protein
MLFLLAIGLLVVFGSLLALAEAAISRTTPAHAAALAEEGRRNAALLDTIEREPARYLNAVYLAVMFAQNGSAILAAILADRHFGDLGVTIASIGFTLAYFVVVEAMSKTFAILHSDRVALALAPFVWVVGRTLSLPTRALIGLANVLLPGKGLKSGPFVTQAEIRSMADAGHEEGSIEPHERQMIHSVFEFGERVVSEVMTPRPDVVALSIADTLDVAVERMVGAGLTRIPVYRDDLDHVEGMVHAKDVLELLYRGRRETPLTELLRPVRFVPESKRVAALLREMQRDKIHLVMVSNEYGLISGLATLEDLLEELVGQIRDEHDREVAELQPLGGGRYRINAILPIIELNDALDLDIPHEEYNTVGGLVFALAGRIPRAGEGVALGECHFTVEKIDGRRILTVLMERRPAEGEGESEADKSSGAG